MRWDRYVFATPARASDVARTAARLALCRWWSAQMARSETPAMIATSVMMIAVRKRSRRRSRRRRLRSSQRCCQSRIGPASASW